MRKALIVALALACSGVGLNNANSQTPAAFTIGGVVPLSGAYALLGTSMQKGAEIAIEERAKVLGVPIKAIWEDTETKPQTSVQKANKLLAGGVSMLFGDGASGQTLAIMPLAQQRKIPLLVTTSAADQIHWCKSQPLHLPHVEPGFQGNPDGNRVREEGGPEIRIWPRGRPAGRAGHLEHDEGGVEGIGVQSAGEDFAPIGSQDYSIIIDKISKSGADGVFVVTTGSDTITFLKQAGQVRLNSRIPILRHRLSGRRYRGGGGSGCRRGEDRREVSLQL